jgi:adenosylhomocysteine nucleosidase
MNILVTYAVQGEFTELRFPGVMNGEEVHIGYLRTGMGKVKSAYYLTNALAYGIPDLVINLGTAGTIERQVGDVVVCRRFIDRDMQAVADALGAEYEIDMTHLLEEKGLCSHWTENGVCNTGDSFLTELGNVSGDVVDMEAYAQAFVCREKGVPFISVKCVTDILGQNSVKHWEDKVAEAAQILDLYFNEIKKGV